ncbi:hypothetical protein SC1083_2118 [Aggregatibacter actinomycetemcomitans serotype e str. SC1083]|uniref:Uncharacterized protein n=1 Tax=Aggregatibacter actinomycetemcomitans serotype e str. SC1083 TaxID=907488 RepID=G4AB83_AGGAC|nr:hypothetical protein SC1083_2118 [Aggregatibacter actinomycetemcomitans serotype e str. SC1083]
MPIRYGRLKNAKYIDRTFVPEIGSKSSSVHFLQDKMAK